MPTIGKQWAQFAFGSVQQERGAKHLKVGELIEAINVEQQPDGGPFVKRLGLNRVTPTYSGAAWSSNAESILPGDGTNVLARDGENRAWAYAAQSATYYDRGKTERLYPKNQVVLPVQLTNPRPVFAFTTSQHWTFAVDTAANAYYYTVTDLNGAVVQKQTKITATGILQVAAVHDSANGYVWALWVAGGTTVTAHRFTVTAPGTAPTVTTYQTIGATTLQCIDARYLSVPAEIAVVVTSLRNAVDMVYSHSYLDPATGAARAAPAPVTTTLVGAAVPSIGCSPCILLQDGTGGSWHYAFWGTLVGFLSSRLRLIAVTSATLAITATTTIVDVADAVSVRSFGVVSGYVEAATGDRVLYAQHQTQALGVTAPDPSLLDIHKYRWTGAALTTTNNWMRGSWLASTWDVRLGNYYAMVGFDDTSPSNTNDGTQRILFIVNQDAEILTRTDSGPALWNRSQPALVNTDAGMADCHVATMVISNNVFYFAAALVTTAINNVSVALINVVLANRFGQSVQVGEKAISAGGIPIVWSKTDKRHELGPLLFPSFVTGVGASPTAAVYRITDADGTVWRSSPVLVAAAGGAGTVVTVPTLRHTLPDTQVEIEIYVGATPQLQGYVTNDKTVNTLTFTCPNPLLVDETLYTTGGALSNAAMFRSRAVVSWRGRVFSCQESRLDYSQEIATGFGPQFNEVLSTMWTDGTGDILGLGVVDWNYLVMFKIDAIGVISGPGPDGRGQGNYVVQTLTTKMGCVNVPSITTAPAGCFFQDSQTGRICVVTPGLQALEAAPGADDYTADTITEGVHVESKRQVLFIGQNTMTVLDYRHVTEASPYGQVYRWTSPGGQIGGSSVGCVDNTGLILQDVSVTHRPVVGSYQDNGNNYAMRLATGDLEPFGIQGELGVSRVQVLGTFRAAHTINVTTYPDYSATGTSVAIARTTGPEQIATRPPNCGRVQSIRVTIEESASTGQAFEFEGLAVEFQSRGRAKMLNKSQVI